MHQSVLLSSANPEQTRNTTPSLHPSCKMASAADSFAILIVDDDAADRRLFVTELRQLGFDRGIYEVEDGAAALAFLSDWQAQPANAPIAVLLDVNMPRINGVRCLRAIRSDPALRETIVFVMTTSRFQGDSPEYADLEPSGYLVKGNLAPAFKEAIGRLKPAWQFRSPAAG